MASVLNHDSNNCLEDLWYPSDYDPEECLLYQEFEDQNISRLIICEYDESLDEDWAAVIAEFDIPGNGEDTNSDRIQRLQDRVAKYKRFVTWLQDDLGGQKDKKSSKTEITRVNRT